MRSLQDIHDETEVMNDLFCLFVDNEFFTFEEAMEDKRWRQAMEEEINIIKKNDTWELSKLPMSHETIEIKWMFKFKKKNAKNERSDVSSCEDKNPSCIYFY